MTSFKLTGPYRLISFFLIAVLLICVVGFAVNGWENENTVPDSGENGNTTDNTDENTDGNNQLTPPNNTTGDDNNNNETIVTPEEKFYNKLTGLEISKAESEAIPFGYVMSTASPLYGVANADITIEFPTEKDETRMLVYKTGTNTLWKIGALAPTRDFITGIANFFGGVTVSLGNDDIVKYSAIDTEKINLNIKNYQDTYFKENALYIYTSSELIQNAYKMGSIEATTYKDAPFLFSEDKVKGVSVANTLTLPYSQSSKTELFYSEETDNYLYFKNGNLKIDMLTGENISFKNVFILFADATTYEKADGTELVLDTLTGGIGYYASGGYKTEIRWNINKDGKLEFKTLDGKTLVANRGNSYIGYYKSSLYSSVKVS